MHKQQGSVSRRRAPSGNLPPERPPPLPISRAKNGECGENEMQVMLETTLLLPCSPSLYMTTDPIYPSRSICVMTSSMKTRTGMSTDGRYCMKISAGMLPSSIPLQCPDFSVSATIFSIPYYSSLSLFPADPPAFTIPSAYPDKSKQPKVSLSSFPLPDGNWRWVSKSWMVDMRSGSGEVQHDGFEYNWSFRNGRWRSEVGYLSMGGFVRRRRWVRLMMRPGQARRALWDSDQPSDVADAGLIGHDHPSWIASILEGRTTTLSIAPSISTRVSEVVDESLNTSIDDVWQGCDADQHWARCHALMKRLGRDGRKLELWKRWLDPHITEADSSGTCREKGKQRQQSWTEDNTPRSPDVVSTDTSPPPLDHIALVLQMHVSCMHQLHSRLMGGALSSTGRFYPSSLRVSRISCPIHQASGSCWVITQIKTQAGYRIVD